VDLVLRETVIVPPATVVEPSAPAVTVIATDVVVRGR
jgi:hypothetical protein